MSANIIPVNRIEFHLNSMKFLSTFKEKEKETNNSEKNWRICYSKYKMLVWKQSLAKYTRDHESICRFYLSVFD